MEIRAWGIYNFSVLFLPLVMIVRFKPLQSHGETVGWVTDSSEISTE